MPILILFSAHFWRLGGSAVAFWLYHCPLCSLLFPLIASAQSKYADLSAALNVSAIQPGKDAVVAVVLSVHDGYHAQSQRRTIRI